jgi:hypothetical protein
LYSSSADRFSQSLTFRSRSIDRISAGWVKTSRDPGLATSKATTNAFSLQKAIHLGFHADDACGMLVTVWNFNYFIYFFLFRHLFIFYLAGPWQIDDAGQRNMFCEYPDNEADMSSGAIAIAVISRRVKSWPRGGPVSFRHHFGDHFFSR